MRHWRFILFFLVLAAFVVWHSSRQTDLKKLSQTTGVPVLGLEVSNKDFYKIDQRIDPTKQSRQYSLKGRYVVGSMEFGDHQSPVELRTRGNFEFHQFFNRKSWRVKSSFHQPVFPGTTRFNLARSRFSHFEDHLVYDLARDLGIPAPWSFPVLFMMNGDWHGVYHVTEQMDELFLKKLKLPYAPLYGEYHERSKQRKITEVEKAHLGDRTFSSPWTNGFTDIRNTLWQYLSLRKEEKTGKADDLDYFLKTIKLEQPDFIRKIDQILDINEFQKWLGLQILAGSPHTDFHNIRLFYNPREGKFQFMSWDLMPFRDYISHRRMPVDWVPVGQELFLKLFLSPEFAELRNRHLWQLIHRDMPLTKLTKRTQKLYDQLLPIYQEDAEKAELGDMEEGNPAIQNGVFSEQDFIQYHEELIQWLKDRYQFLENSLKIAVLQGVVKKLTQESVQVVIQHQSESGLEFKELVLAGDEKIKNLSSFHYTVAFDANHNQKVDGGEILMPKNLYQDKNGLTHVVFDSSPLLLAARTKVPMTQIPNDLQIELENGLKVALAGHVEQVEIVPTFFSFLILSKIKKPLPKFGLYFKNTVTEDVLEPQWVDTFSENNSLATWGTDRWQSMMELFPSVFGKKEEPQSFVWEGEKEIQDVFTVKETDTLTILPGTILRFSPGASLMIFGQIVARGTKESPILFTAKDPQQGFGVIAINGSRERAVFEHVIIEYGKEARIRHIPYSGALSVYNADILLKNSIIRHNLGEDAVNVKYGDVAISDSQFLDNNDGIDADFSTGTVSRNIFNSHRNDAIDLGSAKLKVDGNQIFSSQDKGISVGWDSLMELKDTQIEGSTIGMAIKDTSRVIMETSTISKNEIGVKIHVKNRDYKLSVPGFKLISGDIVDNQTDLVRAEKTSFLNIGGNVGSERKFTE